MTTTNELRALDEEIARLRGWAVRRGILAGAIVEAWWPDADSAQGDCYAAGECSGPQDSAPGYSSSWGLAGPLLEEAAPGANVTLENCDAGGEEESDVCAWEVCIVMHEPPRPYYIGTGATPYEAIARAWLAWRKAQP